jgi:hypothetical protein
MKTGQLLIKSLRLKYEAEMADAIARFSVYAENPVGIGEHPQITQEMDKLVQQYTDSVDKLSALKDIWKTLDTE